MGLTACTFSGTYLEPPESRATTSDINGDIQDCISVARISRDLTPAERDLISGKETVRFFMNGRPVVTQEGRPALHQSLLPQLSYESADRYAVCLINRGYKWEQI
jgi:hypothetical protein